MFAGFISTILIAFSIVFAFACLMAHREKRKIRESCIDGTDSSCSLSLKTDDFALEKNSQYVFLSTGEFDVCGHHLVDPFIYVAKNCHSKIDEYAIRLSNQPTGIFGSNDGRQRVMEMAASSFENRNLFRFSPEQTDYFLTWLEYYNNLSVIPRHCYSRWMGGLCIRALIEHKDVEKICRKMLEFTLRYHSSYNRYADRVSVLINVTACCEYINTPSLQSSDRAEFRRLLDEAIAPLPYFFFKPGWQWDPAFLYQKLTGCPRMSLFKSSQVWLGKNDDWSYVDAVTGESTRGTNKYAAVLLSLLYVYREMVAGRSISFEPKPKTNVTSSHSIRILDFVIPSYKYIAYGHAEPFIKEERNNWFDSLYRILEQDWHVSAYFRGIPWDFKTCDELANTYCNLPTLFKVIFGYYFEPYLVSRAEQVAANLCGKLMSRRELLYGERANALGDRTVALLKDSKYGLWVEDGPRWNAATSLHCICDHSVEGLIPIGEAQAAYGTDGGARVKNVVAFNNTKARGLSSSKQEQMLENTELHYREKLRGSLFRISLENGEIPSVFVVCANMIDEEGYIEQSRPHVFGCWDNAVYRAVMLDSSNPDARVFIVAKRSIEDATFSVVWDNVWIVDDQQFVEAGIRMKMKRAENLKKRKEAKSNCCPFPEDEYAYQKSENP